jgi:MOSC domain-containing protein YiiM
MGKVLAVNISEKRETVKINVYEGNLIVGWGLENDAHGGDWDRQISIFPVEAMEKVPENKREEVLNGGYTENITISGIPLEDLSVDKVLKIGDAVVKILHIGKEKYKENGRPYIVSREGRFGKVVKSGRVKVGDNVQIIEGSF